MIATPSSLTSNVPTSTGSENSVPTNLPNFLHLPHSAANRDETGPQVRTGLHDNLIGTEPRHASVPLQSVPAR